MGDQEEYEVESNWLDKPKYRHVKTQEGQNIIPKGSWEKCSKCLKQIMMSTLISHHFVCDQCHNHFYMPCDKRIDFMTDPGSFKEHFTDIQSTDPLQFKAGSEPYKIKLQNLHKKLGLKEAIVAGTATLNKIPIVLIVMEFRFIGGSMGSAVGERIYQSMKLAAGKNLPFIAVSSSGGARMQEGILSLMQMAKTCAGVEILAQAGVPFISILTNPTMGGVTASFASLGDVIISEPQAMIGFAGRRVIEQTVRQKLAPDFQNAELLKQRGFVDMIIDRHRLKSILTQILKLLQD